MKNKKIIIIVVILISIINIIYVVSGYLITLYVNSTNYYGTTHNITVLVVLVLVLQIMNIIIISKKFNDNYKKKLPFSIIIILVTFFIPTKVTHNTEYNYPTKNDTSSQRLDPADFDSTTYTNIYINLYGITLIENKSTKIGIEIVN